MPRGPARPPARGRWSARLRPLRFAELFWTRAQLGALVLRLRLCLAGVAVALAPPPAAEGTPDDQMRACRGAPPDPGPGLRRSGTSSRARGVVRLGLCRGLRLGLVRRPTARGGLGRSWSNCCAVVLTRGTGYASLLAMARAACVCVLSLICLRNLKSFHRCQHHLSQQGGFVDIDGSLCLAPVPTPRNIC